MRRLAPLLVALGSAALSAAATAQVQTARPQPAPAQPPPSTQKSPLHAAPASAAPMKVRIVRSNEPGCEPDCPEWISAEGQIMPGTTAEFRRVLARLGNRKLPIMIDSIGGSVDAGIAIGRLVRAKGLDVVVTKTVLVPCTSAPADAECRKLRARGVELGRPEAKISKCASSCAFILAGGVRRYVGVWTVVGLHEIRSTRTLRLVRQHFRIEPGALGTPARKTVVRQETLWSQQQELPTGERTYDNLRKFFVEMGVSDNVMTILRSAPHVSIRWLRIADLKATGLATDFINGEQLLAAKPPAAPVALPDIARAPPAAPPPAAVPCSAQPGSAVSCATGSIPTAAPAALPPTAAPAAVPGGAATPSAPVAAMVPPPSQAALRAPPPNAEPAAAPGQPAVSPKARPRPKPRPDARSRDDRPPLSSVFQ